MRFSVRGDAMDTPTKRCARGALCVNPLGCDLPATIEYFGKDKHRKSGLNPYCRVCARKKANDLYYQDKEAHRVRMNRYHKTEKGKAQIKRYQAKHKEHIREQRRRYKQANRERITKRNREIYVRKKLEENPNWKPFRVMTDEERRVKNRANGQRFWRRRPEMRKVYKQKRRVREVQLPYCFSGDDWQRSLDYFQNHCAACGRPRGLWHTLAPDHWIPISSPLCPGTVPTNMIPLCHGTDGCNNSKCGKLPEQWLVDRFGARKAKQILKRINDYFDWVRQQDAK